LAQAAGDEHRHLAKFPFEKVEFARTRFKKMAYTLQVVDWRDSTGSSHPEYSTTSLWKYVDVRGDWQSKTEAELAAEQAWIEPDCNGVAPVCVVTEC
jgi:hypothetical protein